ncbi:YfhO family protein [Photobacterium alginatilyticum]|uniref:Uncharacterized protein n=1 Tax=Photobacterium alginatilyticum TaxID=1775171 RepID=A0ABW9YRW1_9GAMM|nr:YfhO family protein [Photobacterium alginatilyticum]NBI56216.1 hypothetical protein [Photobacterium alginatilyticum]
MINEVALLLGMLGTGMLALDVARPEILSTLSNRFRDFTHRSILPMFLLRRNHEPTEADREILRTIQIIGTLSLLGLFISAWVLLPEFESLLNDYAWIVGIPFVLALLGIWALNYSQWISKILISSSTALILPFFYLFFIAFGILGTILRYILRPIVRLEGAVIGRDQSPRLLGLLILFFSFALQLFALKS